MKYKDAYDKIIQAYFKDEIKPYAAEFCFCGTLGWVNVYDARVYSYYWDTTLYSQDEYKRMEDPLLRIIRDKTIGEQSCRNIYLSTPADGQGLRENVFNHPNYEDALFEGMCAALEVLKEIHRSRGENVDSPELTKRVLTT